MTAEKNDNQMDTRHLGPLHDDETARIPVRATGPLDDELPWVIDLRIVGTADTIQVQVHDTMIIGRSDAQRGVYPAIDLGPHGAQSFGVSREHAALIINENRIMIKDLGSINGTRLNGHSLTANKEYRLVHGDELGVGQMNLQVRFAVVPTMEPKSNFSQQPRHLKIPVLGHGEHVLVVEDDQDVSTVYRIALEHAGFRVSVKDNGVDAVGFVSHNLPDVIVLDLMLPDINGIDVVKYVRKTYEKEAIPMIVISGATGGFQMNQAKEIGANICLGKPVSVDELVRAVSTCIENHVQPG